MCNDICIDEYDNIYFVGGVAKIKYMKKSFEKVLNRKIIVPENCEYTGAIGIAKILQIALRKSRDDNKKCERIQCEDCNNSCELKKIIVNGQVKYEGGLCGKYGGSTLVSL
jgi:ribulose kinase